MVVAKRLNLIFIPEERRKILLQVSHRSKTGHLKVNKLLQFLKLRYFWTSMAKDIKEFVDKCNVCLKMSPFTNFRPLKPVEVSYPFELVSLDTAHITMPSGNKKYIVVAIDHFTRWIELAILTNETSQSIMNFIEREILMRHGCPKRIQTDGGKPYVSSGIKNFFAKFNVTHDIAAPYHPESNGMAERLIRSLKDRLSHVNEDQGFNLQRNLNIAVSAYWMVPHRATGFSPFVLLYGREAITPYEIPFTRYASEELYQDALSSHIEKMFEIHTGAFLSNRRYQLKMKETFDKKKVGRKDVDEFQTGELV